MLQELLIVLLVILVNLFYFAILRHSYWIRKNVRQSLPVPFLEDNLRKSFGMESYLDMIKRLYNQFPEERYSGYYQVGCPILVIRDPELIRMVTIDDFDHFSEHRHLLPEGLDPLWSRNLFALKGNEWIKMRTILVHAFSSDKMRAMFWFVNNCAIQLRDYIAKETQEGPIVREVQGIFTRYTNEAIASCAFGVTNKDVIETGIDLYKVGMAITDVSDLWKSIKLYLVNYMPSITKYLNVRMFRKESAADFSAVIANNLKMREDLNIERPDMINILLEARKGNLKFKTQEHDSDFATAQVSDITKDVETTTEISDVDITAQALIFFTASIETVSTALIFMSYELAMNPDVQKRLQDEIDQMSLNSRGKLIYKSLSKMKYMDMVIWETLRKWPSYVAVDRSCVKPYTIQPTRPNETAVHLDLGDVLLLPIIGIHRDPEYFPEPDKFDPERFNDENIDNIKLFTYNPFGYGPRNCIGSSFALMEIKTVFFHLLSKFDIEIVEQTKVPVEICKKKYNLAAKNGIHLGFKRRQF
ncbi:PREDICTED: cytochrome P450 9e2-like [Nicrophorus vespilloides]|uniref:Cytochrome P450 9e2-like n=1 Tax=Nicrophorus vespilloides TaxID=110193 RepID=A0ABM1M6J6_NICVS|nr:PREDICTED: cytochrome P450 9e2-like [Nicrophorus vespilloides]